MTLTLSGTPALAYQWRQGGVNISGATTSTYSKSGIVVGDSGNYDVVVSGKTFCTRSKVSSTIWAWLKRSTAG